MNVRLLIDSIVRQTTVLIAQLATSGGLRAPLAHIAGQVFLELAREIEAQGVPKKVSADMFGMALRTYQRHTQRLSQSRTDRGRSLWEAVFEFIERGSVVTRDDVFQRFRYDDEPSLRGVLRDLTESGLVFSSGSGRSTAYRLATTEELSTVRKNTSGGTEAHVWSLVYREGPLDAERLSSLSGVPKAELAEVLDALVASGRVTREATGDLVLYRSSELVLGFDDPAGWEASVLDHFTALVKTITSKLNRDQKASLADEVGGSTYHFVVWRGHPMEAEVLGELRRFRERMSQLRARVDQFNGEHGLPRKRLRVDAYYGQSLVEEEDDSDGE